MRRYRKKPVVVEAIEWTGDNAYEIFDFTNGFADLIFHKGEDKMIVATLEGDMEAKIGDMIIKGIKGEFYPCDPDIFKETYEEVR